jgi:hypothetical protein
MDRETGIRERPTELVDAPVVDGRPRRHRAIQGPREPALDDRMRVDVLDEESPADRQAGAQGAKERWHGRGGDVMDDVEHVGGRTLAVALEIEGVPSS